MKPLTDRQFQVVRLSALMTDKEIARHLGISPETVDKHMRAACAKLEVSDRKAALRKLARDAPYAPGGIPDLGERAETGPVAPTPVVGDEDQTPPTPARRPSPYQLFGLPRDPAASGAVIGLILRRAAMWMLVIAAGVAVMQLVFAFFDRLA